MALNSKSNQNFIVSSIFFIKLFNNDARPSVNCLILSFRLCQLIKKKNKKKSGIISTWLINIYRQ